MWLLNLPLISEHTYCRSMPQLMTRPARHCPGKSARGWPRCCSRAISRKHICLHTREVPDDDGDSPRDLLTSLPGSVEIWLSWHLVLFLSLKINTYFFFFFSPHRIEDFSEQFGGKQAKMKLWRNSWSSLREMEPDLNMAQPRWYRAEGRWHMCLSSWIAARSVRFP